MYVNKMPNNTTIKWRPKYLIKNSVTFSNTQLEHAVSTYNFLDTLLADTTLADTLLVNLLYGSAINKNVSFTL